LLGNSQGAPLIRFQRYLLREHHIAGYEVALRYKAPSHSWTAIAIELKDVLTNTVLDTIRLSTIAPNDLEVIEALKLLPLLRRQPFA
jgi:hypothetical protein